jgi:hypothetical protein
MKVFAQKMQGFLREGAQITRLKNTPQNLRSAMRVPARSGRLPASKSRAGLKIEERAMRNTGDAEKLLCGPPKALSSTSTIGRSHLITLDAPTASLRRRR